MIRKNLTDAALKNLKPKDSPFKVSDGTIGGLYVAVYPTGKKAFRYSYKIQGKEQLLTIGTYPEFTLSEAREAAMSAKRQLAHGQNPASLKKEAKAQIKTESITFQSIADEWSEKRKPEWSEVHWVDTQQKLKCHIFPLIGNIPIAEKYPKPA